MREKLLVPSKEVSFADVAHQTLTFDLADPTDALIVRLIDTRWMQRLRSISQTGNTRLVYMFAEHSRFGHSLGVAYLANLLMKKLMQRSGEVVAEYRDAVAAAALLHDVGHVAPGSHLAEQIWGKQSGANHEAVSKRIIELDPEIRAILDERSPHLAAQVTAILSDVSSMPSWTRAIISGGGWNADRGNWAIVDSAMCSVSYGRYNVMALIDAFRLTDDGQLVLQENRVDALTHFFVARDSMYRQVYQHRVLQAVDALTRSIVLRLRDLIDEASGGAAASMAKLEIFADPIMLRTLEAKRYDVELELDDIFSMNESWWAYHLHRWCSCADPVLRDLSQRLRDRRLLKTIRLEADDVSPSKETLVERAKEVAKSLGFDPRYYVTVIENADLHREKREEPPRALLDSGEIVSVAEVEPMIDQILRRSFERKRWLAAPKEVKQKLGRFR